MPNSGSKSFFLMDISTIFGFSLFKSAFTRKKNDKVKIDFICCKVDQAKIEI